MEIEHQQTLQRLDIPKRTVFFTAVVGGEPDVDAACFDPRYIAAIGPVTARILPSKPSVSVRLYVFVVTIVPQRCDGHNVSFACTALPRPLSEGVTLEESKSSATAYRNEIIKAWAASTI